MFNTAKEKVAVFIDAANLAYLINGLKLEIDWDKFRTWIGKGSYVVCMRYYTAIDELPNGERPVQRLLDYLSDHGYELITKKAKAYVNAEGTRKVKGNLDVVMACDVLEMCEHVDRVILVTSDGDFAHLVQRVQAKGRRVTVISSRKSNPPMLSGDLRRAASDVIDLADVRGAICGD